MKSFSQSEVWPVVDGAHGSPPRQGPAVILKPAHRRAQGRGSRPVPGVGVLLGVCMSGTLLLRGIWLG